MLYIMRHGKTDWNEKHILQGRTDVPLNEDGRRMAQAAAEEYRNVHFDVCYCSPLIRAKETAELVLKGRDIPIILDDRLIEMSFGIYEGTEITIQDPDCPISVLFSHPENYVTPVEHGESLKELFSRTGEFLKKMIEPTLSQGKDILIVGHGAMNLSIVSRIWKLPIEQFWSPEIINCKLVKLK